MEYRLDLCLPELYFFLVIALLFIQAVAKRTVMATGVLGRDEKSPVDWLPLAALVGVGVSLYSLRLEGLTFYGAYSVEPLSQFIKLAVAAGFFITSLNGAAPRTMRQSKIVDYQLFLACSAWGLMLLASSVELITIFVSLEIASYSLYAVIPLRSKDSRAAEAGIKYILFGAAATALSLYGLSYVLAATHTSYLAGLTAYDWAGAPLMASVGLALFLCGAFFKLALFPFHFWCPDVYEGTGNETAAFAATLPKLGAVVILVRVAALLSPGMALTTIFALFGVASMTYGNLAALAQTDVKRMLGYSSIAHAGYLTLGLVSGTSAGLAAACFYALIYVLMNLACFWVVCRVGDGENLTLQGLNGLSRREPVMAFVLAVSAFALVGLPPTAGFMGKLFLLTSAWNHGYNWLVVAAVLNTAIAIYYYLSIVRHAYTQEDEETQEARAKAAASGPVATPHLVFGGFLAAMLLLLGTLPGPALNLALAAGRSLLP